MKSFDKNQLFLKIRRSVVVVTFFVIGLSSSVIYAETISLGEENSWFRIHNVGSKLAEVDIAYFDQDGKQILVDGCNKNLPCNNIESEKSWTFFQQSQTDMRIGFRGSAFITSTQPFVTLMGRDAFKNDQFQIAGDTLRLLPHTQRQILPIVQNNNDFISRISVQNLDKKNFGCILIQLVSNEDILNLEEYYNFDKTFCPSGGISIPPKASITIDEEILSLVGYFDGFAIIDALNNSEGFLAYDQSYFVSVETREKNGPGLTQYRGIDADEVSTDVVLPVVDKNHNANNMNWNVKYRIVNNDIIKENKVNFLYQGVDNNANYYEFEHTVLFSKMLDCDLRLQLPSQCIPKQLLDISNFKGTVRIKADQGIAVVAQLYASDKLLGDYRGLTAEDASRQLFMPVLNKNYGPFGDAVGWNSWYRIFTFDGQDANIKQYYFSNKNDNIVSPTMTLNREKTFFQNDSILLNNKWVGSGYIVSDKPIVGVVFLFNENFQGDNLLMYNAVSLE
jgi:hypothetical protein